MRYKKELAKYNIKCNLCGKNFMGIRKTRKFCSKLCISRNWSPPKPKKGIVLKCKRCGIEVYTQQNRIMKYNDRFCGKECLIKFQKEKAFNIPCKVCNTAIFTQPTQLVYRGRSTCSPKCRRILACNRAMERRIKFGYTKHQLDRIARYSIEMIEWRKNVFKRDNYTCQMCGVRGGKLEADHIKPFAYFPELRTILSNGRTLCKACHNTTKMNHKKMKEIYLQNIKTTI